MFKHVISPSIESTDEKDMLTFFENSFRIENSQNKIVCNIFGFEFTSADPAWFYNKKDNHSFRPGSIPTKMTEMSPQDTLLDNKFS